MKDYKDCERIGNAYAFNGDLFKTKLEAQWAVFFETAGIKYKYNRNDDYGFIFTNDYTSVAGDDEPSKVYVYAPTFYLPELDVFCNVFKPTLEYGGTLELGDERLETILAAIDYHTTPVSSKGVIILRDIPFASYLAQKGKEPIFPFLQWYKGVSAQYTTFYPKHIKSAKDSGYSFVSFVKAGWEFTDTSCGSCDEGVLEIINAKKTFVDIETLDGMTVLEREKMIAAFGKAREAHFNNFGIYVDESSDNDD